MAEFVRSDSKWNRDDNGDRCVYWSDTDKMVFWQLFGPERICKTFDQAVDRCREREKEWKLQNATGRNAEEQ